MKMKFFSIAVAVVAVTTILSSCGKQTVEPASTPSAQTSSKSTQDQLNALTATYLASHQGANPNTANKPPKWLRVLGADLKGALSGAATGAAVGSAVPGIGTATGAAVGAVAGGAAASIEKAEANAIVAPQTGFNPTGNGNNPQSNYGLHHYLSINAAAASQSNYKVNGIYSNSAFYNFSNSYYASTSLFPSNWQSAFSLNSSNSNLQMVKNNDGLTSAQYASMLRQQGRISTALEGTLVPYFNAVDASTSVEDFVAYSINSENVVNQSTTLNSLDKTIALLVMATGRCGIQYWSMF